MTMSKSSTGSRPLAFRNIHQVRQQARALDVPQKLDSQAVAQVRALDQARDIGHHEAAEVLELHHAQVRFERRKGIVGDLGTRRRDARNQGGLAGVRKPDQPHVRQQFQLQPQTLLIAGPAGFVLRRRLVSGGRKARVAASALAAAGHHEALSGLGEIEEPLAGGSS